MNILKRFGSFWYHFIVGDDWKVAVGVVIGLAATGYLAHNSHLRVWWLLPALVVTMLSFSLWTAIRKK